MRKKIVLLIVILLMLGALFYYFFYYRDRGGPGQLLLSGTMEVTEVEISPELSARVVALYHREGDQVTEGDPLLDLQGSDLKAKLREATAAKRAIEAEISLNRVKMENARREFKRNLQLYRAKAISASSFDAVKTAYEVTKETYTASLHRQDEVQARIETLQLQLKKTHLSCPITGVVLERNVEVGEVVFPGMVLMTIGDLQRPWVRVYIGERDIGKVRLGQGASVMTDAYPERRFPGILRYIAKEAEFTPKNVQTREERVKLVYEARVYLANKEGILKPGMPIDVYLRLEE
ncbi:MAG: efflux RND transporter periplasmic adaptor subunit [Deltaproteobacteria bacterium]|nr:efflux RND transporter periplasmic adaptor subunit [Deltaproteobacteria bacterium]